MLIRLYAIVAIFTLASFSAFAGDENKEIYVEKIIAYQRSSLAGPNSAFLKMWLEPLRKDNLDVQNETWRAFLSDVSVLVESEVLKAGEPGEVMLRTRLRELSENELRNLADFLPSPTFQRYQEALAQPVIVDAAMEGLIRRIQEVAQEISSAASARGLKVK